MLSAFKNDRQRREYVAHSSNKDLDILSEDAAVLSSMVSSVDSVYSSPLT